LSLRSSPLGVRTGLLSSNCGNPAELIVSQALYPNCLSAQTVHIQIRTGKIFSLIKTIKSINPGNQGS
jgi:hypothetical protein